MKAKEWVKKHYKPVNPEQISLPEHTSPVCVLIDNEWYDISGGDYKYYIDLCIKDSRELKRLKKGLSLNNLAREGVCILQNMLHRNPLNDVQEINSGNIKKVNSFSITVGEKDVCTSKNIENEILLPICYQLAHQLNNLKYYSFIKVTPKTDIWSVSEINNIQLVVSQTYCKKTSMDEITFEVWIIEN